MTSYKKRDNKYDYMRVFAMCMVILNHVADYFVGNNAHSWSHTGYVYVCESISHCAIPLFLMLTGVFVIEKAGKQSSKKFYLESAKKLGIPFGIFVVVYFIYDICIAKTKTVNAIYWGILTGFSGMYAHWYMVMLVVVYALLPVIAIVRNHVSYEAWTKGAIIFFIWVMCGHYFESSGASWSLSSMYLIGYVLMGDVIHQKLKFKNNAIGFGVIIAGILMLCLNGTMLYHEVVNGGDYYNKLLNLYGAPLIIVASLTIFCGFTMLTIKKSVYVLSSISYIVFLAHKMVINILSPLIYPALEERFNYDIRVLISVEYMIMFTMSIVVSIIIYKFLNMVLYRRR